VFNINLTVRVQTKKDLHKYEHLSEEFKTFAKTHEGCVLKQMNIFAPGNIRSNLILSFKQRNKAKYCCKVLRDRLEGYDVVSLASYTEV
jgi:hypothetical protein